MSAANGYTRSLGGIETPGLLVVARIPDMNVPVCVLMSMSGASVSKGVQNASVMTCVSACEEMDDEPVQMGDGCGELFAPYRAILVTVLGSCDGVCEVQGAFRARPAQARLRDCDPARERSTLDTSRPCGRRKCRRVMEFGTRGLPRGRVCGASRAAYRVFCSRNVCSFGEEDPSVCILIDM